MTEIATIAEIGRRLQAARKREGYTSEYVAAKINGEQSTITRWENGQREGGCVQIAKAGLLLGLNPNELLMRSPSEIPSELPEEGRAEFARLFLELATTVRLIGPEGPDAINTLTQFFEKLNRKWTKSAEISPPASVPIGTTIEQTEPGVKVYTPPPIDVQAQPSNTAEARGKRRRKG